jgi:SAM-dependent methyltransferase
MELHPAVSGFDAAAEDYERGRPGYPGAVADWIVSTAHLAPGSTVVDLAAGTGKLTRLLPPSGARVVAVEPVAGMRAQLQSLLSGVEALEGTAESLPLEDDSADAVTVAQAFHWFDGDRALPEIHRVLRPGGRLLVIWNRRDIEAEVQAEFNRIVNAARGDTPSHSTGHWRQAFERSHLFGPLQTREFSNRQVLDVEGVVARGLSVSFVARLGPEEKDRKAAALRDLATRYAGPDGRTVLPYVVDCHWCEAV